MKVIKGQVCDPAGMYSTVLKFCVRVYIFYTAPSLYFLLLYLLSSI